MTVLVTGAAGFIGYHVAEALIGRGEQVVGIDDLNAYYTPVLKEARLARLRRHAGFSFHPVDISDKAAFDAALIDYAMPETSGAELAAMLARGARPLPVVLMTGFAEAALGGAWEGPVLQKPFELDAACSALDAAIARETARA